MRSTVSCCLNGLSAKIGSDIILSELFFYFSLFFIFFISFISFPVFYFSGYGFTLWPFLLSEISLLRDSGSILRMSRMKDCSEVI